MKIKTMVSTVSGMVAATMIAACSAPSIEGQWVESIPGMENEVQGLNLEAGGVASSINMATLQYEKWEKKGDWLILSGKSIGNHMTIPFTDTLVIDRLTDNELVVTRGTLTMSYRKQ